jgi:catechol 2,3-dioxygenase-like lactoylglutathione lyase family enzyme
MTLHHVSLEVRRADVPGEIRFWELLGFTETEPAGTIGERASWVQRGPTHIHLLYAEDPVVPPQGHAAVVVDDFDATVATLVEAGLTPKESTRHWGAARAFVHSPAGHTVELMAEPPPV